LEGRYSGLSQSSQTPTMANVATLADVLAGCSTGSLSMRATSFSQRPRRQKAQIEAGQYPGIVTEPSGATVALIQHPCVSGSNDGTGPLRFDRLEQCRAPGG
jgi:hypothetical protein